MLDLVKRNIDSYWIPEGLWSVVSIEFWRLYDEMLPNGWLRDPRNFTILRHLQYHYHEPGVMGWIWGR